MHTTRLLVVIMAKMEKATMVVEPLGLPVGNGREERNDHIGFSIFRDEQEPSTCHHNNP